MVIAWPSSRVWEALGESLDSQHSFLDPNLEQSLQGAARLLHPEGPPGSLELMVILLPMSSMYCERMTDLSFQGHLYPYLIKDLLYRGENRS